MQTGSNSEMYVYEIAPTNDGQVRVYILIPGGDRLIGLSLDEARRFAGDLLAEIGRFELPEAEQPAPLSIQARRVLNFAHRHMEINGSAPTLEEIADYLDVSRYYLRREVLKELEAKGWYRDSSWGGVYKRPLRPPFLSRQNSVPNVMELDQLQLAI